MKKLIAMGMLLVGTLVFGQGAPGEIVGTIVDLNTKEKLYGAKAWVEDGDRKYQGITDPDGRFRISAVPAGKYELSVIYMGDTMANISTTVPMDGFDNLGVIEFTSKIVTIGQVVVGVDKSVKLVYGSLPVKELTSEEIEKSPAKFSVQGMVTSMSSEVRMSEDGELMFRGARKGDMIYMLDGVKSREVENVPSCAIGRMMVYTGGLPAKYGDTLGGVVVLETKSYFDLYRAWEAEQIKLGNL
jgi:hypothetical protein